VVQDFRDAMLVAASGIAPLEAWTLGDADAAPSDPDSRAGRSPTLALAPDVRSHTPMLVKTIAGDENVHQVHRLIGGTRVRVSITRACTANGGLSSTGPA
jgi:hypothetical protein